MVKLLVLKAGRLRTTSDERKLVLSQDEMLDDWRKALDNHHRVTIIRAWRFGIGSKMDAQDKEKLLKDLYALLDHTMKTRVDIVHALKNQATLIEGLIILINKNGEVL